jgi:hypothetical protein
MSDDQPIPFFSGLASGLNELTGASQLFVNFLVDVTGAGRPRPGYQAWADFPAAPVDSPVIGMFPWRQYLLFVTEDRQIWAWLGPGLVVALSDTTAATRLDGSLAPVWTFDSQRVAVVGGGAPQQWQGAGLSSRLATVTMPDGSNLAFTHIAYIAQRFVANDFNNSGIFQWTDPGVGNHGTWPIVGAYWQEAEASPDPNVALFANTNELFVFGQETLQVYFPDPVTAFAAGAAVNVGCTVAGSVINTDGMFAWLDDRHRFVISDGRTFEPISTPAIANDIMAPGFVVSDCRGYRIHIGTWDLLLWVFPTMKRGFCYDRTTKKWQGEFRAIDGNGEWLSWAPQSYVFWEAQNMHLVGLANGTIAELRLDANTDMGTTIKAVARTGFLNRGTFSRKLCQRVRTQFRGDIPNTDPSQVVELRYRDDLGAFKPAIRWTPDQQPVAQKYNLGMYRQREWELEWSGGGSFAMTGATESIEMGDT